MPTSTLASHATLPLNKLLFSLCSLFLLPFLAPAQTATSALYSESNYVQITQGVDPESAGAFYAIRYRNTEDTTYFLKKTYLDSSYTKLMATGFYKKDMPEGPYQAYENGVLSFKGHYTKGLLNGEALTYYKGKLTQRAFYANGIRNGTWEEFDLEGKPTRKITYDQRGHLLSEERVASTQ